MERAAQQLSRHDATVLGVTYQDVASASLRYVRRYGITYPNLRNPSGALANAFGTRQVPESFLINREGQIVAISRGEIGAEFVKQALALAERG